MTVPKRRGVRSAARPVVLTDRDVDLLTLVGLCRYAGTHQVARELFPTADRCRRRCRQLFDAGYLRITLVGSTLPSLLSLTRTGIAALHEHVPDRVADLQLPGPIQLAAVPHHLAVVDVRLYLAALATALGGRLLAWSGPRSSAVAAAGFHGVGLEPDGYAVAAIGTEEVRLALEVDRATEDLVVLGRKLDRYCAAFGNRALDELWLVVDAGPGRVESLGRLAAGSPVAGATRVMTRTRVVARPVQRPPEPAGAAWAGTALIRRSG